MKSTLRNLNQLDLRMTALFWDAECILRDGQTSRYTVFPKEPHDEAVAAAIGATIVGQVEEAVLVWVNDTEET
jgi:hypothetical protein